MRDVKELADPRRVLLWDLDGTVVDTGRDIAMGVEGLLRERGLSPLPLHIVLRNVGQGVRVLVTQCLEDAGSFARDEEDLELAVRQFGEHYSAHLMDTTVPYGNIPETLRILHSRGRKMAVISNKPEGFTQAILDKLGMLAYFSAVLGGDTLSVRKPSPEPILHALRLCDPSAAPSDAILFGDSITDLRAARAAGIPLCAVAWGFDPERRLRGADPDWWVKTPEELGELLLGEA